MAALRTRATASETGDSPFAVSLEMGEFVLTGDEPVSAGGGGLGPNPFQLITAALAECTAMTVRWFARQRDWPLDHVEVTVDHVKKLIPGGVDPVDVFDKVVIVRGLDLTDEQHAQLIRVADQCPIQRVLEGAPRIDTRAGPRGSHFDT